MAGVTHSILSRKLFTHVSSIMKLYCKWQQLSTNKVFGDMSPEDFSQQESTLSLLQRKKMKQEVQLAWNYGSLKARRQEERWGRPDSWHERLRYPPGSHVTSVLVAVVMYSTPPSSMLVKFYPSCHAAEINTVNFWSSVADIATAEEKSEVQNEAISLWPNETCKLWVYIHDRELCLFQS